MGGRHSPGVVLAVLAVAVLITGGLFAAGPVVDDYGPDATTARPTATPAPPPTDADFEGAIEALHEHGVDGLGARVGVVDATPYALDEVDGNVVASRAFDPDGDVRSGGRYTHGTAVVATLTATAPAADLLLATVGTPGEFGRAIEWLLERDVDVIVAPVSFYGQPDDGTAAPSRALAAAADRGVTVVVPTGNLARSHWDGPYDAVTNGTLSFDGGPRNRVLGDDRELVLWLSWRGDPDGNYTAVLYREDGSGAQVVARSSPYEGDGVPNERIVAPLDPDAQYAVEIRGPPNATDAIVELESPTHRLEYARPGGSLAAPATTEGVLAVGAYDADRDRVAPYSSRGPTADGRPGVDVVAPAEPPGDVPSAYAGTSMAAARVAGIAALLHAGTPALIPERVQQVLAMTAIDAGRAGYDFATGYGLVAPFQAAARLDVISAPSGDPG